MALSTACLVLLWSGAWARPSIASPCSLEGNYRDAEPEPHNFVLTHICATLVDYHNALPGLLHFILTLTHIAWSLVN
jgi:hypothetical protein